MHTIVVVVLRHEALASTCLGEAAEWEHVKGKAETSPALHGVGGSTTLHLHVIVAIGLSSSSSTVWPRARHHGMVVVVSQFTSSSHAIVVSCSRRCHCIARHFVDSIISCSYYVHVGWCGDFTQQADADQSCRVAAMS